MIAVGPTAIVIFILLVIFLILYRLADKVDKEDELRRQWKEYYNQAKEYSEYWSGYMWQ